MKTATIKLTANQTRAINWAIEHPSSFVDPRILGDNELDLSSMSDADITHGFFGRHPGALSRCDVVARQSVRGLVRKILNYQLSF